MYAGIAALLAESLEVIQRTSALILDAMIAEESVSQDASANPAQAVAEVV
jgi:hypothetical protein